MTFQFWSQYPNGERNVIIMSGLIGTLVFGYLTLNYLDIIPKTILPIDVYIFIYYMITGMFSFFICLIIIGMIFIEPRGS